MLRAVLALAIGLAMVSPLAIAQAPDAKGKDDTKAKSKDAAPAKSTDPIKNKTPLDQMKVPKNAIVVVVDNLVDALALFPKSAVLSLEKYQELLNEIETLKKQLKSDKMRPSSCVLTGKLQGDDLLFRAEFGFSTERPKTTVVLGLKGGHLTEEGDLDGAAPSLEFGDDGFTVRVDKEGSHRLALNLRVPVQVKKSALGPNERGIDLGLPGAAATIVNLELPANIKEIRWNDTLEKTRKPGRWQINGLEKSKTLALSWKEPVSLAGNAPLTKVDGQINVRIDEKFVTTAAELSVEDVRGQTKEWKIQLPAQAKVEVKPTAGLSYELLPPDGKSPFWTLRAPDATAERWQITVYVTAARPNPGVKLPIGPFNVVGAFQQQGVIHVQMPGEVSFGQRLVFTRLADVFPLKSTDAESVFQYSTPSLVGKGPSPVKAPLELEWRFEKNQLETRIEHQVKLTTASQGWEIEAATKIHVKALFAAANAMDIKLPLPRPHGVALVGTAAPAAGFPTCLPWPGMWKTFSAPATSAIDDYLIQDEQGNPLKVVPQDALGRVRVIWDRPPAKHLTLLIKHALRVTAQDRRLRIDLPRPVNTLDRGAKLVVQCDDRTELLLGPAGAEEPVPDRRRFDLSWDLAPSYADVVWRPHQRAVVAYSIIDVTLHGHSAQIRQTLRFPLDRSAAGADPAAPHVRLNVPAAVNHVEILSGGQIADPAPVKQMLWLRPEATGTDEIEIVLQYDLPISKSLQVEAIWPAHVSQKDVKVRVWPSAGMRANWNGTPGEATSWRERGVEAVADKGRFPSLVLHAFGAHVPLTLQIDKSGAAPLAAFVADRALIQVIVTDDGSQQCRARYLLRRIQASSVDVELPLPLRLLRDRPVFTLDGRVLEPETLAEQSVRIKLHPDLIQAPAVLDIQYAIPADALERVSTWRTVLHAPRFSAQVVIGEMRWQLSLPNAALAASLAENVRVDTRWTLQGWLPTPAPSQSAADLESWIGGRDSEEALAPVTISFSHWSRDPQIVYHLPRWGWWLVCSGLFLILALGAYYAPWSRQGFWLVMAVLGIALIFLAGFLPGAIAPVLFGLQPGVVLFLLFVGVHWCVEERYRRQLVFMTGFRRNKPASTVVRGPRPREASTVDAPPLVAEKPGSKASGAQAGS